jgi:hypothetical protein
MNYAIEYITRNINKQTLIFLHLNISVYSFSCVANPTKAPHGPWFPCMSQYDTSLKRTITRTDFAANTITFGEVTQRTNLHLFALGVAFATPVRERSFPQLWQYFAC